jgi:predicted Zn-dependent protease
MNTLRPWCCKGLRRLPLLVTALLLASCATVPETGRRELLLISPGEEAKLGISEFQKIKQSTKVCQDEAINGMARRVGERIAAVAPLPNAQWEFVVFDEPKTVNAFCLPGGKVGIYTGILQITRDELGLATVIGHEVAHAVARHGAERLSRGMLMSVGALVLDVTLSDQSDTTRAAAQVAYGLGGSVGVMLPHSRLQETEADHLGLLYMARAGFDPRAALEFWKRFAEYNQKQGGGAKMAFLSTHPLDSARIQQIERELPAATAEYEKYRR